MEATEEALEADEEAAALALAAALEMDEEDEEAALAAEPLRELALDPAASVAEAALASARPICCLIKSV